MKKIIIPIVVALLVIVSIVIVFNGDTEFDTPEETIELPPLAPAEQGIEKTEEINWREITLKDIRTQEAYVIKNSEKVVVLESFAVWCPTCKQQQDQIKILIEQGDDSVHISLNTDPNEDEESVLEHITIYSYDWKFSIFPSEATRSLIDEFGVGVVNAPSAPVIIICPGQKGKLLQGGIKSADELKEEIDKC